MLILITAPLGAAAQTSSTTAPNPTIPARGVSYSNWTIDGTTVRLRFMLPTAEAKALAARGAPAPNVSAVAQAVLGQVSVGSAGGDCPAIDQGEGVGQIYTLALTPGLDRFEIVFQCPNAAGITLHDGLLFDRDPGHVNYARVRVGARPPALQIFTRARETLAAPAGAGARADAGMDQYARLGVMGLLSRLDRICVAAGVLLLARRWRDLIAIAGALGLGYLISISVALSGWVVASASVAEALIGGMILLIGLSSLRGEMAERPTAMSGDRVSIFIGGLLVTGAAVAALGAKGVSAGLAAAGAGVFGLAQLSLVGQPGLRGLVWAPVVLFGLFDGMGPAADLAILQAPAAQLAPALAGWDLGAGAGVWTLAAAAMVALWLTRRWLRPLRPVAEDLAGAGCVGLGLFWCVSRLYS